MLIQNSLVDMLKAVEALTLRIKTALEEHHSQESSDLLKQLKRQNKIVYRQAKREKLIEIAKQAVQLGAQINAIKKKQDDPTACSPHLGFIIKVCQENISVLEQRLRNPGEDWFINSLAVTLAAAHLKQAQETSRVAAILFTKHKEYHEKVHAGNDEGEILLPKHAEVNAIIDARLRGLAVEQSTMFISDIPCFFKWTVKLTGNSESLNGQIVESNDKKSFGKNMVWKKIKIEHNEIYYDYYPFGEHFSLAVKEVFSDTLHSTVYYYYKPFWIPREVRSYYFIRDQRFVHINLGCAITLSFLRLKEVYYIHTQDKFKEGLDFLRHHQVEVHLIDHPLFQRIGGMAKKTRGVQTQRKLQQEIAKLGFQLHVDLRAVMKDRFGIELRI